MLVECTGVKETVCSATIGGVITSGGGFSDIYSRSLAPWQEDAVTAYLASTDSVLTPPMPPLSYFNSTGRGYPDVATYGSNYFVYLNGHIQRESGTSASAPVFAAMVTLWNDMRLQMGLPPLGFIAPLLYDIAADHPEAFQDIVTGDNACGAGHSISSVHCCTYGFPAVPGWDAVTGLGSPRFDVLSNLMMNLTNVPFPTVTASMLSNNPTTSITNNNYYDNDDDDDKDVKATVGVVLGVVGILLASWAWYTTWQLQKKMNAMLDTTTTASSLTHSPYAPSAPAASTLKNPLINE